MVRIGGKGMSYIVKNCPAQPIIWNNNWCDKKQQFCQNCTDCVIKQVIEKCKEHPFKDCACGDDILQLFDIEEINK